MLCLRCALSVDGNGKEAFSRWKEHWAYLRVVGVESMTEPQAEELVPKGQNKEQKRHEKEYLQRLLEIMEGPRDERVARRQRITEGRMMTMEPGLERDIAGKLEKLAEEERKWFEDSRIEKEAFQERLKQFLLSRDPSARDQSAEGHQNLTQASTNEIGHVQGQTPVVDLTEMEIDPREDVPGNKDRQQEMYNGRFNMKNQGSGEITDSFVAHDSRFQSSSTSPTGFGALPPRWNQSIGSSSGFCSHVSPTQAWTPPATWRRAATLFSTTDVDMLANDAPPSGTVGHFKSSSTIAVTAPNLSPSSPPSRVPAAYQPFSTPRVPTALNVTSTSSSSRVPAGYDPLRTLRTPAATLSTPPKPGYSRVPAAYTRMQERRKTYSGNGIPDIVISPPSPQMHRRH